MIVAHFLRFIDPLNYYVVPGKNYQDNHGYRFKNNQIGEYTVLCDYVAAKYRRDIYGETVMDEFRKKVFASPLYDIPACGQCNIDISYGPNICTKSNSSTGAGTPINQGTPAPGRSTTELVLYPSDAKKFKEQLLQRKKAHFVLTYDSGIQKITTWNANDFKPASNLRGNITSKPFWRNGKKEGLIKVEAYID